MEKEVKVISPNELTKRMESLNEKEKRYFKMMRSKYGVLYLKAKPGVAKSAIALSIAKKMGFNYVDLRLSMADETDMQFPNLQFMEDIGGHVIQYAIPEWAYLANQRPTLIHFEELNRAPQAVRNAALKILLEREIGIGFKFNDNVFMMASGNLGEDDNTDVEEFDAALNNRLITYEHDLSADEWLNWASTNGNIHPDILTFIKINPDKLYVNPTADAKVPSYATPRSWEMLSRYIVENYGGGGKTDDKGNVIMDGDTNEPEFFTDGYLIKKIYFENIKRNGVEEKVDYPKGKYVIATDASGKKIRGWGERREYIDDIEIVGRSYLGETFRPFHRYIVDSIQINIHDILKDYPKYEEEIKNFRRDRYSELLVTLDEISIPKMKPIEVANLIKFLKVIDPDERYGYILRLVDFGDTKYSSDGGIQNANVKKVLLAFKSDLAKMKDQNKDNRDDR